MKTKTQITDITHDDLVNLFSTATYGSDWLTVRFHKKDYYGTSLEDDNDCREDKWAKILLNGGSVKVIDTTAEGVVYGNLPHEMMEVDNDEDEWVKYTVTLKDVEIGIAKCLDLGGWEAKCAQDLINDEAVGLDLPEADAIMQVIIFGETIYG